MKISTGPVGAAANEKIDVGQFICKGRSFGGARFFEFHDQKWFPKSLRDGVTDALQFILSLGGIYRPIVPILNKAVEASGAERIVDICSGGGGPWLWLYRLLRVSNGRDIEVCLTDKYPNIDGIRECAPKDEGPDHVLSWIRGRRIIASRPLRISHASSLHFIISRQTKRWPSCKMQRTTARGSACSKQPSATPLTILLTVLMPLAGFLTAPFARPFRISRLFWTYFIPVIPFVLFFDGVVSCLRAYSQKELSLLAAQVKAPNYVWQIGEQSGGLAPITFLWAILSLPRQWYRRR